MSDAGRTERVQRGLELVSRMMRPPLPDIDDPEGAEKIGRHIAELGAELAALDLRHDELDDVQLLYFQGRNAVAPLENERFAKWAYLAKHAPGATISEAEKRLTPEEFAEYQGLTAEDL